MAGKKGRSGRKSRKAILGNAMDLMIKAAPEAAQYLFDVVSGAIPARKVSYSRIDCAKYVIDQVHGKAPTKVQVSTPAGQALVSYTQLILMAESAGNDQKSLPDEQKLLPDCRLNDTPDGTTGLLSSPDRYED
jgi:hypothetical protein